jgi:hypothetical protein
MRTCAKCGVEKDDTEFYTRSDTKKLKNHCIPCDRNWHARYYAQNAEAKKAEAKEHFKKPETKERRKAYLKARAPAEKAWNRDYKARRNYGISADIIDMAIDLQRSHCPICRRYVASNSRHWHVDHNHKTGDVRGIICSKCNLMLGHSKDDPEVLRRAADYLEGKV